MTFFSLATPNEGDKSLTIMYDSGDLISVPENHPNFVALVDLFLSGESNDDTVSGLVNTLHAVGTAMAKVSERITVAPWGVFFDNDPIRGELADTILRVHSSGDDDALAPLVAFMEKASTNPNIESVDALYRWIESENLTITSSGDFIGYKGVYVDSEGNFKSKWSGTATVDGVVHEGHIPYPVGAVAEMPRSEVDPNSNRYCAVGLHVGTWSYAQSYGRGDGCAMIRVQVNPRDVVMVPNGENEKMRVCRYLILGLAKEKITEVVVADQSTTWKKGQMLKISTSQGLTRVFAKAASTEDQSWLGDNTVVHVYDIFENGRNSKGHFVKGFKPKGLTRTADGRFTRIRNY